MGYVADIACHIRGNRDSFFDIQEKYFESINEVENFIFLKTTCINKKEYILCGQSLWNKFIFNPVEGKKVDGKFIMFDIKWNNFCHQWSILLETLTQFGFSWFYLCVDYENIIAVENNKEFIKDFDMETTNYFSIEKGRIKPMGIEIFQIKSSEKQEHSMNN